MLLNGASDRYALKRKGTIFELLDVLIFFTGPVAYYNLPTLQDKSFDGSSSFGGPRFVTRSSTSCFILYSGLFEFAFFNSLTFWFFRFASEHCELLFFMVWKWTAVHSDGVMWSQLIYKKMSRGIYRSTSVRCLISGELPSRPFFNGPCCVMLHYTACRSYESRMSHTNYLLFTMMKVHSLSLLDFYCARVTQVSPNPLCLCIFFIWFVMTLLGCQCSPIYSREGNGSSRCETQ